MKINIARDGNSLGAFEVDQLKSMAKEGMLRETDFAYLTNEQRWEKIQSIPSLHVLLFADAERTLENVAPPPPLPPPPPPPANVDTPQKEGFVLAEGLQNIGGTGDSTSFQGYPLAWWKAYLGKNAFWFLKKFEGLPTLEQTAKRKAEVAEQLKGQGFFEKGKNAQEIAKAEGAETSRFSLPGLLLGWIWVAYRKNPSAFGWFSVFAGIEFLLEFLPDVPQRTIALITVQILGFFFVPAFLGVGLIHVRAQKTLKSATSKSVSENDRFEMIRETGGRSIWWAVGFILFALAIQMASVAVHGG